MNKNARYIALSMAIRTQLVIFLFLINWYIDMQTMPSTFSPPNHPLPPGVGEEPHRNHFDCGESPPHLFEDDRFSLPLPRHI